MILINEGASVKMQRESILDFFSLVHLFSDTIFENHHRYKTMDVFIFYCVYARILLSAFDLFQ